MTIYDIYQSQKGYIWLGTEAGICRYDGVKFETYDIKNTRGKSITNIQEDSQGNIYCMSFWGQLFKIQNKKVEAVALPKNMPRKIFSDYLIDQEDRIWLCADKMYCKTSKTGWKTLDSQGVRTIQQDKQGNIWMLTYGNFMYRVKAKSDTLQVITTPETLLVAQVNDKSLKAVSMRGNRFYRYDLKTKKWTRIWQHIERDFSNQIRDFREDGHDNVWVFTLYRATCYQEQNKALHTFIKDVMVSGFIQDREGNYWFASLGQGLLLLASLEGRHFNRDNSTLDFEQVGCLEEDDLGNLYLGTNGNQLYYLDTKTEKLNLSYKLPRGGVECLFFDKKRQQLYAENNYLSVFDVTTKKPIKEFNLGSTPKDLALFQGKYLISVAGNVTLVHPLEPEPESRKFGTHQYLYLGHNVFALRLERGRAVCTEDRHARFWIAYADGLYYYENGTAKELKTVNDQPIIAISLRVDEEGIVWVGTIQQGIFAIKNKKVIQHLTTNNGLISNHCQAVRDRGFLYIGTDKGLQVRHIKTGQNRIFNQQDGLPSNEVLDLIVQKDKIYLATNRGLSILNKDFSTTNHTPPLIYLTGFDIWDQPQKLQKKYQLKYDENNLTLHFTGLAFRSGGTFRYKYRLRGLDKKWNDKKWTYVTSSHDFVRYPALSAGQYQFEVKAINEDGIESEQTVLVYIDIATPIWKRWWFITAIIVFTLGVMAVIFVNRIKAIRRKAQMEKALGKANLESLKLQMNPHFLFNAMSAIQRYMMRNDAPKASNYLAQFSKLMRTVLENTRSEYIVLEQEIEMLESYLTLQSIQHKGNFSYIITIDEELDPEEIAIPPMFAQPFIENAIEHGIAEMEKEGVIDISFELEDEVVVLKITDNGIGLEKSQEKKQKERQEKKPKKEPKRKQDNGDHHQSLATKITQERIDLYQKSLKKKFSFEISSSAQGTQVIFHLPYQNL